MTKIPKESKFRHAFGFATKSAAVLAAGTVGTKLMGDPLPAMNLANGLLNKNKGPQSL